MALPLRSFLKTDFLEVRDPCGGSTDLAAGIVRMCGPDAFREDPLRVLRAFRFAASLHFVIHPDTLEAIDASLPLLPLVSAERARDEFMATLSVPDAFPILLLMDEHGLIDCLFPEFREMRGCLQNDYHHLDVWGHTLEAVRTMEGILTENISCFGPYAEMVAQYSAEEPVVGRPRSALMKLAVLFHDSGKPRTRSVSPDGRVHFFGHDRLSVEIFTEAFKRLKLAGKEIQTVSDWILGHMRPLFLFNTPDHRRALYRLHRAYGEDVVGLLVLFLADLAATRGPARNRGLDDHVWTQVRAALAVCRELAEQPPVPLLNGRDVMAMFGLSPGPKVGEILRKLAELQATREIADRQQAEAAAKRLICDKAFSGEGPS
jgi:poly(A) polymerase